MYAFNRVPGLGIGDTARYRMVHRLPVCQDGEEAVQKEYVDEPTQHGVFETQRKKRYSSRKCKISKNATPGQRPGVYVYIGVAGGYGGRKYAA